MEKVIADGLARLPSFSHAVVAGDTIYVSGSLGTLPDSMELIPGGVGPETTQTIANINQNPQRVRRHNRRHREGQRLRI